LENQMPGNGQLDRFFTLSLDLFCVAGFDGYFKELNQAWTRTLGYAVEELLRTPYLDLIHPADVERTKAEVQKLAGGEETVFFENRYRCKDRTYRNFLWNAVPHVEDGLFFAAARDVTELRTLQEEHIAALVQQESDRRFRELVENAAYGIYQSRLDGRFVEVNAALVAMLRYGSREELLSRNWASEIYRYPQQRTEILAKALRTGRLHAQEVEWLCKDGTPLKVHLNGRVLRDRAGQASGVEVIVENLSERYALEEQLRLALKMEAIGRLAGGIAHDFNNLLGVISGYSELLQQSPGLSPEDQHKVQEIAKAGQRAANLTRQLLAFSRKQVLQPRVLDLNALVADMGAMFQRVIGEHIKLITVAAPGLWNVRVDPGQIEQVLLNLVVNARDAMPQGGKLTIETANVELDEAYAEMHISARPGPYVQLSISDTGVGMRPDEVTRIFEPFFTTKEHGTGLGLATVYGIVKQSGGNIWVYSEPGKGTTFKVYLPRASEEVRAEPPSSKSVTGGAETILLVEDAAPLRMVTAAFLEQAGYRVLQAENGPEARTVAARQAGEIHLLLTDVVMPEMSGAALAEILQRERQGIKVLFISGYADEALAHHGVLDESVHMLSKPYSREALLKKVRQVLDAGGG
jgi:two-component system cell cycle sensor histidine kinase/response regulator CckA